MENEEEKNENREKKCGKGNMERGMGKTFIHSAASVPLKLRHLNESTTTSIAI
jgi:hypothetical protein